MLKVVQLEELIHVRHSVFVIGNAGTGGSMPHEELHVLVISKEHHSAQKKEIGERKRKKLKKT